MHLQESTSPTLYAQIFHTNVFSAAFLRTYVRTYVEKRRRTYKKFVRKMLMKLTARINFTNILRASFVKVAFLANSVLLSSGSQPFFYSHAPMEKNENSCTPIFIENPILMKIMCTAYPRLGNTG